MIMSGLLTHSPGAITAKLLQDLDLGSDPLAAPAEAWPVFVSNEPDSPDDVITVYDTLGRDQGFFQINGERQEQHGIQIRIRGKDYPTGYAKARAISVALDEDDGANQALVVMDTAEYLVYVVMRTSDVIALGRQVPISKRCLFTINALVSLRINA